MKLTKNHREALLALLEQTNNQITTFKGCIESYKEDVRMAEHFEMNHYLEQERKAAIETEFSNRKRDFWSNATELWVDKHWIAGQGFVHVGRERMRAVRGTGYGTTIPWTQEREDFLTAIETNFKILSDNLNTYLKDLNPEKLDALAASNVKLLPEAK